MTRSLGIFVFYVSAILLGASYLGGLHPLGDSLALFAPYPAIVGLVTAFAVRQPVLRIIAVGLCALSLVLYAQNRFHTTGPGGDFILYQKNMLWRHHDLSALINDIRAQEADVITLQEASDKNPSFWANLARTYPYQHHCYATNWSGIAVISRFPIREGTQICSDRRALGAAQIEHPSGPIWIVSLHLPWPYPYQQAARLAMIEPMLKAMEGPIIIAGDFNMTPGTRVVRKIAALSGTNELRPIVPSFVLRNVPLTIDHILAQAGTVEQRPRFGSDHFGLVGRIILD